MNDSEYAECNDPYSTLTGIDEAFDVAPIEHWELSDFADILR